METMGIKSLVGIFFGAMIACGSAWGATLQPGQGSLVINQGEGFQPVNGRIDANVGDSVMVAPGGTATVTYADGCTVDVQPGAVTTIAPISPCASGSNAQATDFNWGAVALGAGAATAMGFGIYEATKSTSSGTAPTSP